MNQFEFLRSVPVGQYLPVDSPFHRIDPRARLLAFTFILLALTLTSHLAGILIGLGAALLGLGIARVPYRFALRGLYAPLPFLLILVLLQILFNPGDAGSPIWLRLSFGPLGVLALSPSDLLAGLRLLLRFFALIIGLGLMSFTLSTSEMTAGLNALLAPLARLKLPAQDMATMVQITLRFLPLLAQSAERIAKAQAARGADWDASPANIFGRVRQIIPVIVPLFLSSLRKAENMALAMDARAYGSAQTRSSMVEYRFTPRDGLVILGALLAAVAIIWI